MNSVDMTLEHFLRNTVISNILNIKDIW